MFLARVRDISAIGEFVMCDMHSQSEDGNQSEVHHRHDEALTGRDLEIAEFFFASGAKQREDTLQGYSDHDPDNEVRKFPAKPEKKNNSRQPQPSGNRGNDPPSVEKTHWR